MFDEGSSQDRAVAGVSLDALFETSSELTAGDRSRAVSLLLRCCRFGVDGIGRDGLAHRVFLEDGFAHGVVQPIASLGAFDRVVLHLSVVGGLDPDDISEQLVLPLAEVTAAIATARIRYEEVAFGEPIERAFERCRVWFDDETRLQAQAVLEAGGSQRVGQSNRPQYAPALRASIPSSRGGERRANLRVIAAATLVMVLGAMVIVGIWSPSVDESSGVNVAEPTRFTGNSLPGTSARPDGEQSVDAQLSTGYILDPPPSGYDILYESNIAPATDRAPNWFSVYAANDSTHSSGRWLMAVVSTQDNALGTTASDATRIEINGMNAFLATTPSGVTHLDAGVAGGRRVDLMAFGFDLDSIRLLVAEMTFGNGNRPSLGAGTDGIDWNIVDRPTAASDVRTEVFATGPTIGYGPSVVGASATVVVGSPVLRPHDVQVARLLTDVDGEDGDASFLDDVVVADGSLTFAGRVDVPGEQRHIRMSVGGEPKLLVLGDDPVVVAAAFRSVRLATGAEWQQLTLSAYRARLAAQQSVPSLGSFTSISVRGNPMTTMSRLVMDDVTETWVAVYDPTEEPREQFTTVVVDDSTPLIEIDSISRTTLVVAFDESPSATALRVAVGGQAAVDTPIVTVGGSGLHAAAFGFDEPEPYVAQLIDSAGHVLATLQPRTG